MFEINDLLLHAVLDERARERDTLLTGRRAQRLNRISAERLARPQRPSAAQRATQMLTELYGPGQPFGADPALFNRLAWVGIDD
jgi:hypothetical protein